MVPQLPWVVMIGPRPCPFPLCISCPSLSHECYRHDSPAHLSCRPGASTETFHSRSRAEMQRSDEKLSCWIGPHSGRILVNLKTSQGRERMGKKTSRGEAAGQAEPPPPPPPHTPSHTHKAERERERERERDKTWRPLPAPYLSPQLAAARQITPTASEAPDPLLDRGD
ncbi:uncharacterized protein LY79DRAFT_244964 [Colletotrichum navitas]|uniref:Uncharacterized protein n=1 Tax=Colletotrichum navitas TaxID=681940 RepID=A0AAD8PWP2_9PEZI|nr:uncharacterized protein LY79DRAFT_244964 [Colletotrichum navitas]KAK1586039.1 hypothetical protein LY79DRAFT_244964 [Colletotrichum navitas]